MLAGRPHVDLSPASHSPDDPPRGGTPAAHGQSELDSARLLQGRREVVVRDDPDKPRRRVALYFGESGFLGAECVNAPADFVALRTALARGAEPTPEMVADPAVPLRKALAGPQLSR